MIPHPTLSRSVLTFVSGSRVRLINNAVKMEGVNIRWLFFVLGELSLTNQNCKAVNYV